MAKPFLCLPVFEAMEPRLLLASGVNSVDISRVQDNGVPGSDDDRLRYQVEMTGEDITEMVLQTPWGASFDSANLLPDNWTGEDYQASGTGVTLQVQTHKGNITFLADFVLTRAQWAMLEQGQTHVTGTFTGGQWSSGDVSFAGSQMPDQTPVILSPTNDWMALSVDPTFTWSQWQDPGDGDSIKVGIHEKGSLIADQDKFFSSDNTEWAPSNSLSKRTFYTCDMAFVHRVSTVVGNADVRSDSSVESRTNVTTAAPAIQADRSFEYFAAGQAFDKRILSVEVRDKELTGVSLRLPWGQTVDSTSFLPAGWTGQDVDVTHGIVELKASTDDGGDLIFRFSVHGIPFSLWYGLDSANFTVTSRYAGGNCAAGFSFENAPMPSQVPNLTSPANHALNVPADTGITWAAWNPAALPDTEASIVCEVTADGSATNLFKAKVDASATIYAPTIPLDPYTKYTGQVRFAYASVDETRGLQVDVSSQTRINFDFATGGQGWADSPQLYSRIDLSYRSLPTVMIPGDKGSLPVVITNVGGVKATSSTKKIQITTYLSTTATKGPGAIEIGQVSRSINLASGATMIVPVGWVVPRNVPPGTYYVVAVVNEDAAVPEIDNTRNVLATEGQSDVQWSFGNIPGRGNLALTVMDGDTPITFRLTGGGQGLVTPAAGGAGFDEVQITGSSSRSALSIKGTTSVSNLVIDAATSDGSMGSISAATTSLGTLLEVNGTLTSLSLADLGTGAQILINSANFVLPARAALSVSLGAIDQASIDTGGMPVKSLAAAGWKSGTLSAASVGSLTIGNRRRPEVIGDFGAIVDLGFSGSLGSVKVAHDLISPSWTTGSIASISVGHDVVGTQLAVTGGIGRIGVTHEVSGAKFFSSGGMGPITVGSVHGSDFLAGVNDVAVRYASNVSQLTDPAAQTAIRSFTVKGWKLPAGQTYTFFQDSYLSANVVGRTVLVGADCTQGGLYGRDILAVACTDVSGQKWAYPLSSRLAGPRTGFVTEF